MAFKSLLQYTCTEYNANSDQFMGYHECTLLPCGLTSSSSSTMSTIFKPYIFFCFFPLLSFLSIVGDAELWALSDSGQAATISALIVLLYHQHCHPSYLFPQTTQTVQTQQRLEYRNTGKWVNVWASRTPECWMSCISNFETLFAPVSIIATS